MEHPTRPGDQPVALVTGASRGIGYAIAHRLSRDGYQVILSARNGMAIDDAAAQLRETGGQASAIVCDVGDRSAVGRLVESITNGVGRLDVVVNNAGVLPDARRAEFVDYEEWDSVMEVNLTAPWFLACRAKELMGDRGGVILNVASSAAYYPSRGLVSYNVSKAGLVMLTRVLALEWARDGVRVVGVAPGKIDTELVTPIKAYAEKRGQELNPQRRLGAADEVAGLVSYLVSSEAAYITGVVVPVDGGELLVAGSNSPN